MSFNIIITPPFVRELKRLAKKYPSVKQDFRELLEELSFNPHIGKSIGNSCYKIRLAISFKGKGKSGGARVITYVQIIDEEIFLISIYDKSENDSISDKDIISKIAGLGK
ncbi:type II toxin-antitoxin system RelE family toxin [Mucilaginibacter terrae]|uniref:mRNA-degrading endonuclease RelE of RelBE toxin-antitoxin system n=1 Tax=Mucilaginibacter terrae TaxID=1955052 RepID=A0ABU3H075_9SPHI|nr:type II toxin-antitoxin system RelE/ParE family toxin [Mucilaginibacter terrae]MDT3404647.1 mRNA-degrading endonuclease RelE of RelBE toxin-antitoxin system [Mucilaginibacter terrae]